MQLNQLLLAELEREAASTRKLLALVPADQLGWKPHEKSFTIGRLASHVAELPHWVNRALNSDEFDMLANKYAAPVYETNEELAELFESKLAAAKESLASATNEEMEEMWVFRRGDFVISKDTKYNTIRSWMFNHQIHHRGQLTVYLRLLDIPIPGMYGPSADDVIAREKAAQLGADKV